MEVTQVKNRRSTFQAENAIDGVYTHLLTSSEWNGYINSYGVFDGRGNGEARLCGDGQSLAGANLHEPCWAIGSHL